MKITLPTYPIRYLGLPQGETKVSLHHQSGTIFRIHQAYGLRKCLKCNQLYTNNKYYFPVEYEKIICRNCVKEIERR